MEMVDKSRAEAEKDMRPEEPMQESGQEENLNALLNENPNLQSQFDRAISKALNTARSNWDRERAEGEKQRTGQTAAEQEQALNEREQALIMRERRADAARQLEEKGLPMELTECLRYEDDESVSRSLEALERAFDLQVQKAVGERLRGMPPKGGGHVGYASQMRAALGLKQQ